MYALSFPKQISKFESYMENIYILSMFFISLLSPYLQVLFQKDERPLHVDICLSVCLSLSLSLSLSLIWFKDFSIHSMQTG
jgi:hypothetical protein